MIAALALYECVPNISLTRPGRNQGAMTGQFRISSPHVDSPETFSVLLPAVPSAWSCDYATQVIV